MTKEERLKIYDEATKKWGWPAQVDQAIEEMAELIVALNKYKRHEFCNEDMDKEKVYDNLYVELADVSICLEQLTNFFGQENVNNKIKSQLIKFQAQIKRKK
jgi:NTP pyrophosphatase (non-canonical NTP hydrolase)